MTRCSVVWCLVALVSGSGGVRAAGLPQLTVLAGSASKPVMEEAGPAMEEALGIRLAFDFGGSGVLLSRLELTGRGDIYLPASHDYMEKAVAGGLVDPATRVDMAYLVPALLVRKGNPKQIHGFEDLLRQNVKAAIGEPRTVCIGLYARELLAEAGVEKTLLPRLGRARSGAALANLLALDSVDAIIGWRVFAAWFPDRVEALPLPRSLTPRLATFPGAVTTCSSDPDHARRVLAWLHGEQGRHIWRRHGYMTTREEALAILESPGKRVPPRR